MPQISTVRNGARARALLDEHRRLHEDLEAIRSAFSVLPAPAEVPRLMKELAARLEELVPLLRAHFTLEEDGGLFEEIAEAWPNTASVCDHLRGEHAGLLDQFERLRVDSGAGVPEGAALQAFASRTLGACGELARHEERENELLYRALDDATPAQD